MMNQQTTNCSICRGERGSLLVFLVITITAMAVLAAGLYKFTSGSIFTQLFSNNSAKAYYIAESGGLFTMPQVSADPSINNAVATSLDGKIYTLGNNGQFTLAYDPSLSTSSYTIMRSTGTVNANTWFAANKTITYKILKHSSFSDTFNDLTNLNLISGKDSIKNSGPSDNVNALNVQTASGGVSSGFVSLLWNSYSQGSVTSPLNSTAPNLIEYRNASNGLLSYDLQIKVKEEIAGNKANYYMAGLSFRLDDNGTTSTTDDDTYYGVSFFRSMCDPATTPSPCKNDNNQENKAPWIYKSGAHSLLTDDFAGFSQVMSGVNTTTVATSFDNAFTCTGVGCSSGTGSYTDVTTAFAFDLTIDNVDIFSSKNDYIYLGYLTTFNNIQVDLVNFASTGQGINPTFEYSAGSGWTDFTSSVTDGTKGFKQKGNITWGLPLSGWTTGTVNSVGSKYWIRIRRTSNSSNTPREKTIMTSDLTAPAPVYIIFWQRLNGAYKLLAYKLLSAADAYALNSDGTLKAWSTMIVKVVEQYQSGTVNGQYKDDGSGLCSTDNNHCLRNNLITVYVQAACTVDTFTGSNDACSGMVLYPLSALNPTPGISWTYGFIPINWTYVSTAYGGTQTSNSSDPLVANSGQSWTVTESPSSMSPNYQQLTTAGFSITREEIGIHGFYDSTASNNQFFGDFALRMRLGGDIGGGGGGTGGYY